MTIQVFGGLDHRRETPFTDGLRSSQEDAYLALQSALDSKSTIARAEHAQAFQRSQQQRARRAQPSMGSQIAGAVLPAAAGTATGAAVTAGIGLF